MIILDTDHLSALQNRPGSGSFSLQARLESFSPDDIATTAITVEEQMRGWMALIRRYSDVHQQVPSYTNGSLNYLIFSPNGKFFRLIAWQRTHLLNCEAKAFVSEQWILKSHPSSW